MLQNEIVWGESRYTNLTRHGNPKNRLDVAILGDGYTAAQQQMYQDDVDEIVDAFRQIEPMATYFRHFNFHRINIISKEEGAKDRYLDPPTDPKTALGTFFSPLNKRRLVGPDPWVMLVATKSGAPWDKLLVVVNTSRRGGATLPTMSVAYASRNSHDFPRIMIHEAGHSIAKLMDEYDGELPDIEFARGWSVPNFLPWPNVDTNAKRPKWKRWLSPGVDLPTPDRLANRHLVGAFEGASYTGTGVYRPQRRCMMRSHNANFCKVCAEQWIKAIYRRSSIADSFLPRYNPPQSPLIRKESRRVAFKARVIRRQDIRTVWRTKKVEHVRWRVRQRSEDYKDFTVRLPANRVLGRPVPTLWLVECVLEDSSDRIRTPEVRTKSRQRHVWRIITL